jgi:hypothetical protein
LGVETLRVMFVAICARNLHERLGATSGHTQTAEIEVNY